MRHGHDSGLTKEDTDFLGGIAQEILDWMDLTSQMEPIEQVRVANRLKQLINQAAESFFVSQPAKRQIKFHL
jgi:hypothetical protein